MSDTTQGPGWWLASDDKWYPPELHPDAREWLQATPPPAAQQSPAWLPPAQPDYSLPPAQPDYSLPPAQPGYGPSPAGGALPDSWNDAFSAPAGAPGPTSTSRRARKGIPRRALLITCVVVAIVAVAVAVPLGLSGNGASKTPPGPALTAAGLLSRSLHAARATHAFKLQVSEQGGGYFERQTIDFTARGASMVEESGNLGSPYDNVRADQVGKMLYFSGPAAVLTAFDVSSALATKHAGAWLSMSTSSSNAGFFTSALSQQLELEVLSLTKVTKKASSSSVVSLQGGLPKNEFIPGVLSSSGTTLTVSATPPYLPATLTSSGSGGTVSYAFSDWGKTPAIAAPTTATSLAALVAESASGPVSGDQAILQAISVRESDLSGGYTVALYPDGDQVKGQVTLDFCGRTYASENLRVARRQLGVMAPDGSPGSFSTEAVIYTSAGATTTAFAEIRQAAATCSAGFVVPPEGPPAFKTTLSPPPDSTWPSVPGVQRLVYSQSIQIKSSSAAKWMTIYLRRGRILLGIYVGPGATQLSEPIAGQRSIGAIVNILAKRLAALPAADLR